jgi:hypothetical protein
LNANFADLFPDAVAAGKKGSTFAGAVFASIACRLDKTGSIGKLCQTVVL